MKTSRSPAWLLAVLALTSCGDGAPLTPADDRLAAIAVLAGDEQIGNAGEPLPVRLGVRVTNTRGEPVASVAVTWSVTSGAGRVLDWTATGFLMPATVTFTGADGSAEVSFEASRLGTSTVTATVPGLPGKSATFTSEARGVVIRNGDGWGQFLGPGGSPNTLVPIGTTVEWANQAAVPTRILTTVAPGGATFEATLEPHERFRYVPDVPGTWTWIYYYLDEAGDWVSPGWEGTLRAE
jgi:hypothetical protein